MAVTLKRMVIVLLALALMAPATALAAKVPGVSDKEVVIGFSTPLSGPAALWGVTALGAKAWADYINSKGGIHGRKIRCIIKDDGYNPARTLANLQQMKSDIFAVLALLGSAPNAAAKDFFPDNNIPLILPYANSRIFANQPKAKQKWYFLAYPDYDDENHYLTGYAIKNLKAKKIAQFYQNDDYGHLAWAGIEKAVKESGGKAKVVGKVPYEVTERNLSTHALKLKETGADTLIITANPLATANIVKEMAKVGYKPTLVTNFTVADPIMHKLCGPNWVGTYITMAGIMSMPGFDKEANQVVDILMKQNPKFKGKEYLAVFGAVSMMHLAKGLELAGKNLTREGLIKAMEQIKNWKPMGMGAPTTYTPNQHHGNNSVRMTRAQKDGQNHPIGDFVVFAPRF
ncbi:MAG: hypothetical protein C4525_14970 [Desulfarculus sp.]|nr:MAG: hypothetical protein C4525_14970 [Desulfarculus sp.]